MARREDAVWFPRKLYGFGWGLPIRWQGWAVLAGYLALLIGGARVLLPERRPIFVVAAIALTVCLIAVCWLRGEQLRWTRRGR